MKFDIIFATYNSSKWIDNCLNSIIKSDYDLKNISLYFYDNASSDDTISKLQTIKDKYDKLFNDFSVIKGKKNLGFGRANNKAFKYGNSDYVFFLNIDTEVEVDTLKKLEYEIKLSIKNKENIGIWELKQLPYEHPKYYDPITHYTSWASGACFVMNRKLFSKVHGFDKHIFMYCEDVELSWHVRKLGYNIKYINDVMIKHFSYENPDTFKLNQFIYSITNNLYLKSKYGKLRNVLSWYKIYIKLYFTLYDNENLKKYGIENVKKQLNKSAFKMAFWGFLEYLKRIKYIFCKSSFKPLFIGFDYEVAKDGAFYIPYPITKKPLVSIIVRTCGRPDTLRETLISLRNQTYDNIEIVIVEDGKNISEKMIEKEFSDLNIIYKATLKKVGRSKAGNLALSIANGKYFNFLDDDDLFYEDHVSVLVGELEKNNCNAVYSTAFETAIDVKSRVPYVYTVEKKLIRYSYDFNYLRLMVGNCFPIQAVMFDSKLYKKIGGFDETMDALEDWDFWIRYALEGPFKFVDKTTSIYRVPAHIVDAEKRQEFLRAPLKLIQNRYKDVVFDVNSQEILKFENIMNKERELNLLEIGHTNVFKRGINFLIRNSRKK